MFLNALLPCSGETHLVTNWIKKIGNGESLNEPVTPYVIPTQKMGKYIARLVPPKPDSFLGCMSLIDRFFPYDYSFMGDKRRQTYNIGKVPHKVIANLLSRRKPLFNLYLADKTIYPNNLPRRLYKVGNSLAYDYLGIFQICIINLLIKCNDLRFEQEAISFLDYLAVPLDRDLYDYNKMSEIDARWNYTTHSLKDLKVTLLKYLNLFREKRGQKKIDPYIDKKTLYSKYNFGRNCHYYDLKNWKGYEKVIPTKEDLKRLRKAREEFRNKTGFYKRYHE